MERRIRFPKNRQELAAVVRRWINRIQRAVESVVRQVVKYSQRGKMQRLLVTLAGLALLVLVLYLAATIVLRPGGLLRTFLDRALPELKAAFKDLTGTAATTGPGMIPRATLVERFRHWLDSRPFAEWLRWTLLLVVPFLVAFWLTAYYLEYVFHLGSHTLARKRLVKHILPITWESVVVQDGNILPGGSSVPFFRMGGPVRLKVHPGNVAVMEQVNGPARFIGPGKKSVSLRLFERLRTILDLREKNIVVNIEDRTQDGIRLAARRARFHYHISRGPHTAGQQAVFDPQVVEQLVYRHWVGGDWENPEKRVQDMAALVESELRGFVSRRRLVDFMAHTPQVGDETGEGSRHLNPFSQFAEEFSQRAGKYAGQEGPALFQFEWTGQGEWVVLPEIPLEEHTAEWLLTLQNQLIVQPTALVYLRKETQQAEFDRLVREALVDSLKNLGTLPPDETKRNIVVAYKQKFEAALQADHNLDERLRADLTMVVQQLNRLAP